MAKQEKPADAPAESSQAKPDPLAGVPKQGKEPESSQAVKLDFGYACKLAGIPKLRADNLEKSLSSDQKQEVVKAAAVSVDAIREAIAAIESGSKATID